MVASSILLLVLSSATMAVGFGVRHVGHTRRVAEAERIAATKIEEMLIVGSRGPLPGSGNERFAADGRVDADGPYAATWKVEMDQPVPLGARLRVEVTWNEGTVHKISLTTYLVPEPGPVGP